jgi:hypothetical protein
VRQVVEFNIPKTIKGDRKRHHNIDSQEESTGVRI